MNHVDPSKSSSSSAAAPAIPSLKDSDVDEMFERWQRRAKSEDVPYAIDIIRPQSET